VLHFRAKYVINIICQWFKAYKDDAEPHVWKNEKETCLTYYFMVPEENEHDKSASPFLLAFEGYTQRSDLYDIHLHSDAMAKFLPKIGETMITGLDLSHFEDVCGFLDKADDAKAGVIYVSRIKAHAGKRDELLGKLKKLADAVDKNEKDCYSYLVLKSLDNEEDIRIMERYGSKKGLEDHLKSKEFLDTFKSSKDIVAGLEGRRFVECEERGWLHR
jgi:quinol monooxygenase YgiN